MTRRKLLAVAVGILGTLAGVAGDAWAGGGSPQGPTPCLADRHRGATRLRGTVAIRVQSTNLNDPFVGQNLSFVLRLEREGVTKFFRLHFPASAGANINGMTNAQVACVMLGSPDLVLEIITAFGLSGTGIVIGENSIKNAEDLVTVSPLFPGTTDQAGSMADIVLFVMP